MKKIVYQLLKINLNLFFLIEIFLFIVLVFMFKNRLNTIYLNLNYKFQREYRDGALLDVANEFKNFQNPYNFTENSPSHTYSYGLIPPLITGLIARFTKQSLIDIQLISSFILILFSSLIMGFFSWKKTKDLVITGTALVTPLVYNNVTFRLEIYAIFITILILILAQHKKQHPIVEIFLGIFSVLLFYIKQYFVILWFVLLLYYLLSKKSKKFILVFCITSGLIALFIYQMVDTVFPLYFPQNLISHINLYGGHSFNYMIMQFAAFFKESWSISFAFLFYLIYSFIHCRHNLKNIFFIYIFVSLVSLLFLGQHMGTYLTYYNQLLQIPIVLFIIWQYKKPISGVLRLAKIIFVITFLINYSYFIWNKSIEYIKIESWNEAVNYIQQNNPQTTYLSPHFTSIAIENSWPIYDNGQTEYFIQGNISEKNLKIFQYIFPQTSKVESNFLNWQNNLNQKVKNKYFSLIALPKGLSPLINKDYLNNNYYISKTINLPINLKTIEFWKPF
jgi:hypothetical protein